MNLVHRANELLDVTKILRQGLKSPRETGNSWYHYTKDSDIISFIALEEGYEDIAETWGNYHFVLSPEWVKEHAKQFREHAEEPSKKHFLEFVRDMNIKQYDGDYRRAWNQILSLKPVPVEAISELIAPSSNLEFLEFYIPENIRLREVTNREVTKVK